ncbi:MAG: NAD/NADP octopine/nopaline dehydrogenase family protein [Candidatus Competibacterales bacterium]
MRVAILGAGAIALGAAALLAQNGHRPSLWSPSGRRTQPLAEGRPLVARGAVEDAFHPGVAPDPETALAEADTVLLALPANGHKAVMDAMAPYVRADHTVIISSHASFGALYLSRCLATRGLHPPIVAWGTTATSGRSPSPTEVQVSTVRAKIDLATLPEARHPEGLARCEVLFGERFVSREGLLAITLSNLNPQNHLGIALCNLTRMELGETWSQARHVTPTVGRLLEALDGERLAIARTLGLSVRTIFEHFALSFHVPQASVSAMNQAMHQAGRGGTGPDRVDSRYVTEDVPFGLVVTALLGRLTGCTATLHEAGIALFSALYGRDFPRENDLIKALDLENIPLVQLQALARHGYS